MLDRLKARIPHREVILRNRFVKPVAHLLRDPNIWHFNRRSVAKGAAIGLFIGILLPLGQMPLAALAAVPWRGNAAVAALTTFVTNPFTTPVIWVAALAVGDWVLRLPEATEDLARLDWVSRAIAWIADAALPIALGLTLFATIGALAIYGATHIGWRMWVRSRWAARRRKRLAAH